MICSDTERALFLIGSCEIRNVYENCGNDLPAACPPSAQSEGKENDRKESHHIAKLKNRFHVFAAEIDEQDTRQIIVIGRFGTDVMIHPVDENHFHASMIVTVSSQFFGWLAGIGKGIRISWLEDVREEYKAYLKEIIECE